MPGFARFLLVCIRRFPIKSVRTAISTESFRCMYVLSLGKALKGVPSVYLLKSVWKPFSRHDTLPDLSGVSSVNGDFCTWVTAVLG